MCSPSSNWYFIANHAEPIPDDWIPVPQLSHVDSDNFNPIIPGKSYDHSENKDPYPQFCWTSLRLRKSGSMEAAGEDHWPKMAEENNVQPEITQRPRFLKRFMERLVFIGRRVTREGRVLQSHSNSSSGRTPTSDMSSCSSCND